MTSITAFIKRYFKLILFIAVIAVILLSPIRQVLNIQRITEWIESIRDNPLSGVIYGAVYVAGVVLMLPGLALTVLAGVMFGFVQGSIIVIIASNIGIQLTFFIARYLGQDYFQSFLGRLTKEDGFADRMSGKIEENGFMVMLYLRLIPLFPFNVINYATGLTPVKYKHYALASMIGMLPGTLVYVYLASSAADIRDNPMGVVISIGVLVLFTVGMKLFSKKNTDKLEA